MEKCKRSRWIEAIVYPGEEEDAVIRRIEDKLIDYAAITHDRDVNPETGELKKAHTHVLMAFKDAKSLSAVAKLIELPPIRLELKANGKGAMSYLLHETDAARKAGKARYGAERLRGSLAETVAAAAAQSADGADEGRQVLDIVDWIDEQPGYIGMAQMARWAAINGRWATFRRAGVIFKGILSEHNDAIAAQEAARIESEKRQTLNEALTIKKGGDPDAYLKARTRNTLEKLGVIVDAAGD